MDRWNRILNKKVQLFVASYMRVTRVVPKCGWSEEMYVDAVLAKRFSDSQQKQIQALGVLGALPEIPSKVQLPTSSWGRIESAR